MQARAYSCPTAGGPEDFWGRDGRHTGDAGERQTSERTSWHRVISFNPRVIRHAQQLEKDDTVAVRGCFDHRTYEKDGHSFFITEFIAEELDPIRAKRLPSSIPSPPPADARTAERADMLRITVELLPGGRERGARVISRGTLPMSNVTDLAKVVGGFGDPLPT